MPSHNDTRLLGVEIECGSCFNIAYMLANQVDLKTPGELSYTCPYCKTKQAIELKEVNG